MDRSGRVDPDREAGRERDPAAHSPGAEGDASLLSRQLAGDLPCVVCGYNLRGVSIRSECPECGTPVRAAILAVVDPHARELRPIPMPRFVGAGLVLWSSAALGAALLCWLPQIVDLWRQFVGPRSRAPDVGVWTALLAGLSGIGAMALVRPHAGLGAARTLAACMAVAAYAPLAYLLWRLGATAGVGSVVDYLRGAGVEPERLALRVGAMGLLALIVLGLRPNARVLVARSLALRQGRVDRQTLAAVAVAAGVAASGEILAYLVGGMEGAGGDVARLGAVGLIAIGSALVTIGMAGALIDSVRIATAINGPSPALGDLLEPEEGGGEGGQR